MWAVRALIVIVLIVVIVGFSGRVPGEKELGRGSVDHVHVAWTRVVTGVGDRWVAPRSARAAAGTADAGARAGRRASAAGARAGARLADAGADRHTLG